MFLRKLFMCWPGFCGMATAGNETHLWGECPRCGKRAGVVSREALRRYADAQAAMREADKIQRETADAILREVKYGNSQ